MILINLLLKFSVFGIVGVVINFLITFLLKEYLKVNKYISNSFGYLIAISFNFFANKFFTFKSDSSEIYNEVIKFIIVTSIGILINHIVVYLLTEKKNMNFYFSKIAAVLVVFIWNFTLHSIFTFKYFVFWTVKKINEYWRDLS